MRYADDGKGHCRMCGAPFVSKVKFNNGNVKAIPFATCTCEEEIFEARMAQKWKHNNRGNK